MKKISKQEFDVLINGIKNILSNDRCSFSEDERVLLNQCILVFERCKIEQNETVKLEYFAQGAGMLLKVFTLYEHIKNLF